MAEGQRADPFGAFAAMDNSFIATLASSFLDKSPRCLAYFGLDRLCRFANSNFSRTFGLDPAAISSVTLAGIMGQEAGKRITALEAELMSGGTVTFNLSVLPPERDGTEVNGYLIPHFDGTGAVIGYIASLEDVTDRHRALDTLLRREKFVTSLLDAAVDGILTIDARGMVQSVNRACCKMFGFDEIELVGAPLSMLMPTPHQHRHAAYVDNYTATP
jgi:PAS domain-containing protein